MQQSPGERECQRAPAGTFVLGNGSVAVRLPSGQVIDPDAPSGFRPCDAGTVGTPNRTACLPCPLGRTSLPGAMACIDCAKGQYSDTVGGECKKCPKGYFQPQEQAPSAACAPCRAAWKDLQTEEGAAFCQDPGWATRKDCEDTGLYLNDSHTDPSAWACTGCPRGASCAGAINASGIVALFGHGRCPGGGGGGGGTPPHFEACSFAPACLGAPNPALEGKYKANDDDGGGKDPATLFRNETCATGYRPHSFLCGACAKGYSFSDLDGDCDRCPDEAANVAVAVFGLLVGLLGLLVYIHVTLSDAGSLDDSDGAKSIGLSYVQVLSLLATFPVAWPAVFVALFQVGGAVTVLGTHLVNVKCLSPKLSEAEVFYAMRLVWACVPPLLCAGCALCWWALRKRWPKTWKPKLRASVVALLYLVWPGLCSEVFALFACRDVCDAELRLRADLDELCFEGRHAAFAFGLGLPMLLAYVLGLPLAALVLVLRQHRRAVAQEKPMHLLKGHLTFGLFYSAFREKVWWWEGTVAVRKIGVAAIGVFGASMLNMQVHLTLLMVAFNFVLTLQAQPYGAEKAGLQRLEHGLLGCLLLTLWVGSVFNSHPRCEAGDGTTLGWCDFLSVAIGLTDLVAGVVALLYFLHLKGVCTCLGKCFGTVRTVGSGVVTQARLRASRQRQAEIRRRTVDARDTTTLGNPVAGNATAPREIELVEKKMKKKEEMHTNPTFSRTSGGGEPAGGEGVGGAEKTTLAKGKPTEKDRQAT